MAATLEEINKAASDPTFQAQMQGALLAAADRVAEEQASTPNHAARLVWAREVFINPGTKVSVMTRAVLAQNKLVSIILAGKADDDEITDAVFSRIDVFA